MPLSFFSPDGRISVAAAHSPLRSRKSSMASKRPRSLSNTRKGRPSTMSCSTCWRSFFQKRRLLSAAAADEFTSLDVLIQFRLPHTCANVQQNQTRTPNSVLARLRQTLPQSLQFSRHFAPSCEDLLKLAVSLALLAHGSQFLLADIGELGSALLPAGQIISRGRTARLTPLAG